MKEEEEDNSRHHHDYLLNQPVGHACQSRGRARGFTPIRYLSVSRYVIKE